MPARKPSDEAPPHTVMAESDDSLVAAARSVFADDIAYEGGDDAPYLGDLPAVDEASAVPPASTATTKRGVTQESTTGPDLPDFGRPDRGDMITVRGGGLYLPVRRRVGWMRGMPEPHPDWTIDTYAEEIVRGTFKTNKVDGGYARYRANVYDETGRLIGTGTKTEYSERFPDFAEKAETGAIGRALAVCGYGTEAAIDLDEGLDQERIADAPVMPTRSINITPSAIPGVRAGGRPARIEQTQIKEIARLNKALGLGVGLTTLMEAIKGETMPPLEKGKEQAQMVAFLETFTHEQAGELVQKLGKALMEQQAKAAEADA